MSKLDNFKDAVAVIREGLASLNYSYNEKLFNNLPMDKMNNIGKLQTQLTVVKYTETIVTYVLVFFALLIIIKAVEIYLFKKKPKDCYIKGKLVCGTFMVLLFMLAFYFAISVYSGYTKDDAIDEVRLFMDYAKTVNTVNQ